MKKLLIPLVLLVVLIVVTAVGMIIKNATDTEPSESDGNTGFLFVSNDDIQRFNVTYYRYVVSALGMTNSEISDMLRPLGSKQQAIIRKMINAVKSLDYKGIPALHHLYKAVTYRS